MAGGCVFYMEPPRRESHDRSHEFPALLIVSGDVMLTMADGAGAPVDHIKNLAVVDTDQVVERSDIGWVSVKEELKPPGEL